MLISELINPKTLTVLKTKVNKCLNMSFDDFIRQYNSHKFSYSHKPCYVEEYNHLLYNLCTQGVIDISDEKTNNGIKIITTIDSDMYQYLRKETIEHFGRERKEVSYNINLKHSNDVFKTFVDDVGTNVPLDTFVAVKFLHKQIQSRERGVPFSLTFNEMKKHLSKKKCHYSGVELTIDDTHSVSLDRVDSTLGYVSDNVVPCSSYVNSLKNLLIESRDLTKELSDKELKNMLLSFANML